MSALMLFLAVFGTVFMLGFQSINVNQGHFVLAACTSLLIGVCNIVQLKLAVLASTPLEIGSYLIAGPVGIVASMLTHRHVVRPFMEKRRHAKENHEKTEDARGG